MKVRKIFRPSLEAAVGQEPDVVVLADLKGGTPNNVAARVLAEGGKFDLYSGTSEPAVVISSWMPQMLDMKPESDRRWWKAGIAYISMAL